MFGWGFVDGWTVPLYKYCYVPMEEEGLEGLDSQFFMIKHG